MKRWRCHPIIPVFQHSLSPWDATETVALPTNSAAAGFCKNRS